MLGEGGHGEGDSDPGSVYHGRSATLRREIRALNQVSGLSTLVNEVSVGEYGREMIRI
jgi:hypothetical protein